MKVTKTILTTIELSDAEIKLLDREYTDFIVLEKAGRKSPNKNKLETICDLLTMIIDL